MRLLFVNNVLVPEPFEVPVHHEYENVMVRSAFPRWLRVVHYFTCYQRSRSWFSNPITDRVLVAQEVVFEEFSELEIKVFVPLIEDAFRRGDFTIVDAALQLLTEKFEGAAP